MRTIHCLLATVATVGLAGCGLPDELTPFSVSAADGLVTYSGTPSDLVMEPLVLGTLEWDAQGTCWYTASAQGEDERTTVFPEGTTSRPGESITLPDGGVVRAGQEMQLGSDFGDVENPSTWEDSMACGGRPAWYSPDPGVREQRGTKS